MSLTAKVRRKGEVAIIDFEGGITLGDTAVALRDTIRHTALETKSIVVNLAGVSYMDSAGLGELVGCYASVTGLGGQVKLAQPQPTVEKLIRITRVDNLMEVHATEAGAITSFGRSTGA